MLSGSMLRCSLRLGMTMLARLLCRGCKILYGKSCFFTRNRSCSLLNYYFYMMALLRCRMPLTLTLHFYNNLIGLCLELQKLQLDKTMTTCLFYQKTELKNRLLDPANKKRRRDPSLYFLKWVFSY